MEQSLEALRARMDAADAALVKAFSERMQVSGQIAMYKLRHNMAILDPAREQAVQDKVAAMADRDLAPYLRALYDTLFSLSRLYQQQAMEGEV